MSQPGMPIPPPPPDPMALHAMVCAHCHMPIEPDPQLRIFVVIGHKAGPGAPIILDLQMANEAIPLLGTVLPFGSIICLKKWLLDWVDKTAKWKATVNP